VPEVNRIALRFFAIPVNDAAAFEQELNGFLARHKVVSIDRRLIDQGVNSFWAICVDYLIPPSGDTARNLSLLRRGGLQSGSAAEESLEIPRNQMRLAKDLQCLKVDSYGFAKNAIDEIGRLVGGWPRSRPEGADAWSATASCGGDMVSG
jgi:hypothetical protein